LRNKGITKVRKKEINMENDKFHHDVLRTLATLKSPRVQDSLNSEYYYTAHDKDSLRKATEYVYQVGSPDWTFESMYDLEFMVKFHAPIVASE
jgi:hypothetical protein